jgi:hypothetical protein
MELQPPVIFGLPEDPAVLEALGTVTIRHGQLDYILRMTVCSISGTSKEDALNATSRQTSGALRDRIRKLAKRRFGESKTLVQLDALLNRARCASERRNELVHNLWARELDGGSLIAGHDHELSPAPTAAELRTLASDFNTIAVDFIKARQEGFLFSALAQPVGLP